MVKPSIQAIIKKKERLMWLFAKVEGYQAEIKSLEIELKEHNIEKLLQDEISKAQRLLKRLTK